MNADPRIENTISQLQAMGDTVHKSKVIFDVARENGLKNKEIHEIFITEDAKVAHGKYDISLSAHFNQVLNSRPMDLSTVENPCREIPMDAPAVSKPPARVTVSNVQKTIEDLEEIYVPKVDYTYVPWGEFNTIKSIIASRQFFPVYISGMSGNGKTLMVEQACAKLKREYVRIQITPETDESDLIGSFRLVNGETVFYKGPVVKAAEAGAILLIDECDRGSNKILALQGILEGKPILIKKIGQVITPALGFNIIATANTKGRGSEDGRYSAATIIDDAFIERFVATIEQEYPNDRIEREILINHMKFYGAKDEDFADKLVAWSQIIRRTYESDGVDEVVSTRRLCHIVKAFSIFKDRAKSIAMCIARFDEDTRSAFNDLYSKIDAEASVAKPEEVVVTGYNDANPYEGLSYNP